MAKACMAERDKRKRKEYERYKSMREANRAIMKDPYASPEDKQNAQEQLQKKRGLRCQIRNRCLDTGRPRGVYRKVGLCRQKFREGVLFGLFPGFRKASW